MIPDEPEVDDKYRWLLRLRVDTAGEVPLVYWDEQQTYWQVRPVYQKLLGTKLRDSDKCAIVYGVFLHKVIAYLEGWQVGELKGRTIRHRDLGRHNNRISNLEDTTVELHRAQDHPGLQGKRFGFGPDGGPSFD